jgi:hypothetical protein
MMLVSASERSAIVASRTAGLIGLREINNSLARATAMTPVGNRYVSNLVSLSTQVTDSANSGKSVKPNAVIFWTA